MRPAPLRRRLSGMQGTGMFIGLFALLSIAFAVICVVAH
jgi:hypothetical protein